MNPFVLLSKAAGASVGAELVVNVACPWTAYMNVLANAPAAPNNSRTAMFGRLIRMPPCGTPTAVQRRTLGGAAAPESRCGAAGDGGRCISKWSAATVNARTREIN